MNPRRRSDPGTRNSVAPGVNRAISAIVSSRSDSSGNLHYLYPGDEGYEEAIAARRARIAADDAAAGRANVINNYRIVDDNLIVDNNRILGEGDIPPAQESLDALMIRAHAARIHKARELVMNQALRWDEF